MQNKINESRNNILDEAELLFLDRGVAGTSIDSIVSSLGLTKGSFFHHFTNKKELCTELIARYCERDCNHLDGLIEKVESENESAKDRLFALVQCLIDELIELETPWSGCLFAAFSYQQGSIPEDATTMVAEGLLYWRVRISKMIQDAFSAQEIPSQTSAETLADMLISILEGSFVQIKALGEPKLAAEQMKQYKLHLELLLMA
jgi:TetR/AcrR family transcriptional repressor of nem operon